MQSEHGAEDPEAGLVVDEREGREAAQQLSPYRVDVMVHEQRPQLGDVQLAFRQVPSVDADRWEADRRAADEIFGEDDPLGDTWQS